MSHLLSPLPAPRWRRAAAAVLLASAVAASGCSPAGDPSSDAPTEVVPSVDAVTTADASITTRIGRGRAIRIATEGATTVVASTLGVHVAHGDTWADLPVTTVAETDLLALAPDGSALFARRGEHTELWALTATPALVDTMAGVSSVGFTDTGLAVVVAAGEIRVLDPVSGRVDHVEPAPADAELGEVVVADDGSWWAVTVSGPTGTGVVTSVDGGRPAYRSLPLPADTIVHRAVADPAAPRVVLGISEGPDPFSGRFVAVDLTTDRLVWSAEAGEAATEWVWDTGPDGRVLVVDRATPRIVGPGVPASGLELAPFQGAAGAVRGTSSGYTVILRDGTALGLDPDGTTRSVSAGTGRALAYAAAGDGGTTTVAIDSAGAIVARDDDGATVRRIDDFVAGFVNDVAVTPDGRLAVATSTGVIHVVSGVEPGSPGEDLVHPEGNVDAVAFSPEGDRLVAGIGERRGDEAFDDTVSVWNLDAGTRRWSVGGEAEEVVGCSSFGNVVGFAADGSFVTGVSHDYVVSLADPDTGATIRAFPAHLGRVWDTALSPDGRWLATSAEDSTLRVWNTESGERVLETAVLGGYRSMAYLPDGSGLVASDTRGLVQVIDPSDGAVRTSFESQMSPNAELAVSPDGRLVAGGDEATVRLWSVRTGRVVAELSGHTGLVESVAFLADGSGLVSGASDGTAVVWHLEAS